MNIPQRMLRVVSISILSALLFSNGRMLPSARAQTTDELQFNTTPSSFEDSGRPPSRTSAGSRDACLAQVVALVPGTVDVESGENECGAASETLVALTLSAQPTFWFYIPESLNAGTTAEFVVLDDLQQPVAIQSVALGDESGIVGVQLEQPLEIDQIQRWVFSIDSEAGQPSQITFVEGLVKYIEPSDALRSEIAAATSDLERIRIYADHGIWHDALTLLAQVQQTSETADHSDWANFLESVGLGAIAQAPLLECCASMPSP